MADSAYEIILAREIERIVSSPYPTQLKRLRDLLCADTCSEVDIRRCIAIKSCKVLRLAICLLEGLPQWPYVLNIITRLACDVSVRDALIHQHPNLINDIVSQAIKSETALRHRYADAAVALLAYPLGSSATLPSNVQELFVQLIHRTVQQPSRYTIRSIYLLLRGTSTLLLGLLDSSLLWEFEQQLLDVLKSTAKKWQETTAAPDPKITMYCLAIMATIINVTNEQQLRLVSDVTWDSQQLLIGTQSSPTSWDASEMREYFAESKKGSKTMHLLVLQASHSLSMSDDTTNLDSVLETLQLANEIIPAFSTSSRRSFCATSGQLLSKLQKKALAPEVNFRLRLLAFCFAVQLSGEDGLLSMTVDSIRECICRSKSLVRATYFGNVALLDPLFEAALTSSTTTMLVQSLLDYLVDQDPKLMLESQSTIAHVIAKLQITTESDEKVAKSVADAVATASTYSKLQDIQGRLTKQNQSLVADEGVCVQAAHKAYSEICHALCVMLLQNALTPRHRIHWEAVSPQTTEKLLIIFDLASYGKSVQACAHSRHIRTHAATMFAEEASTPTLDCLDWRQVMEQRFGDKMADEQQALVAIFAHACADLESRCVTDEEPMKKEIERRKDLEKSVEDLSTSYKQLEAQNMEHRLRSDFLVSELEEKDEALQLAGIEIEDLERALSDLRNAVQDATTAADHKSVELQQAMDNVAVEYAATIANKQHLLDDALRAIEEANVSRVNRDKDVQQLEQDLQRQRADAEASRIEILRLEGVLSTEETRLAETMDRASKERADARKEFEMQLADMRCQAERARLAHEQQMRETKEQARSSIDANNASHNEVLERLSAQHEEEIAKLEAQLSESEEQIREAQQQIKDLNGEVAENLQTVQEQYRKIERLEKRYKAKDDEVKAQIRANNEWRSKLLLDLSMPPHAQALAQQRVQETTTDTQTGDDPSPPTPASVTERPAILNPARVAAGGIDESRSPALKRSRKSTKIAAITPSGVQTRFSLGSIPRSSRPPTARTQRQPLHSISLNQSRRLSVPEKPPRSHRHEDDAETVVDEETQYEGSEIFTGTQQNDDPMNFDGL